MPTVEKIIDLTDLKYYHDQVATLEFAQESDLDALTDRVEEIISEGGEPNIIESVKVNGTALPVSNKAVDVTVPTTVSALTNDGDGNSPFATQAYVGTNGGKIDSISVNGTAQTIDANKNVDITVPTKVSDLTNDSGFQTASDVSGTITTALANSGDPYMTESDVADAIAEEVTHTFRYKGSVQEVADLPATGNEIGDVWDVLETGVNYAWDGTNWDPLGTTVDMSQYWDKASYQIATTAEIDAIFA